MSESGDFVHTCCASFTREKKRSFDSYSIAVQAPVHNILALPMHAMGEFVPDSVYLSTSQRTSAVVREGVYWNLNHGHGKPAMSFVNPPFPPLVASVTHEKLSVGPHGSYRSTGLSAQMLTLKSEGTAPLSFTATTANATSPP